jgi:NADH:ubiquinone oxidoreductase subunit 3 (subunit A)
MSAGQSYKEILKRNRYKYLVMLLTPVFGIIIAMLLIAYLGHQKLGLISLILSLIMFQYLTMVALIWRKILS